jgi:hypothetical protein
MRRLSLFCLLALVLAAPAFAFPLADDDGTLSVKRGRGYVGLNFNGVVIGRIAHGRVIVNDPVEGDGAGVDFWGCEVEHPVNETKTICKGDDIHFRAVGGKYGLNARGYGISLSAVGHGVVRLDGRGDETDRPDGIYSFNDEDYASLPDEARDFALSAATQG